jgi:hypothetical protein
MQTAASQNRIDPASRLPGEGDIETEARKMFAAPDEWMGRPHPLLGGQSPEECIAFGDEQAVRDLLRGIIYTGQT